MNRFILDCKKWNQAVFQFVAFSFTEPLVPKKGKPPATTN